MLIGDGNGYTVLTLIDVHSGNIYAPKNFGGVTLTVSLSNNVLTVGCEPYNNIQAISNLPIE